MACDCPEGVYCKHRQVAHTRSGMGMKKAVSEVMVTKDVKHNKQRSQAQERELAAVYKEIGYPKARRTPMSGALHEASLFADVEVENLLLVEAKQSRSGKLVVEQAWLDKVRDEAKAVGKRFYALHGWVADGEDNYRKFVVVDESTWLELAKENRALDHENTMLRAELESVKTS